MSSAVTSDGRNTSAATGGTGQNQKVDPEEKMTSVMVRLALSELEYQTAVQMEAIQAMMDGVTLGAQQVQDKRLEFLEAGPTTDIGEEILLFSIVLILEGTIGAAVARVATQSFFLLVMRNSARAIDLRAAQEKASAKLSLLQNSSCKATFFAAGCESGGRGRPLLA